MPHMKRAAEWFLTLREIPLIEHANSSTAHHRNAYESGELAEEPIGPAFYDTALSTDEGLWLRTG